MNIFFFFFFLKGYDFFVYGVPIWLGYSFTIIVIILDYLFV